MLIHKVCKLIHVQEIVFNLNGRSQVRMSSFVAKIQKEEEKASIDAQTLRINPLAQVTSMHMTVNKHTAMCFG